MSSDNHRTAPGDLALVHAFLNTTVPGDGRERFDTRGRLQDWLAKRSLITPSTPVSAGDFDTVIYLRTALRTLLGSSDDRLRREQLDMINSIVARMPLVLRFDDQGRPQLVPGKPGVSGAIAQILAAVVVGHAEGSWSRLKQCRNRECQRVFYD